jgi:hypothetical protein
LCAHFGRKGNSRFSGRRADRRWVIDWSPTRVANFGNGNACEGVVGI